MGIESRFFEGHELLWNLILRELRSKYKRSALGWLWSTLNPLATMAIFTVVFSVIFKAAKPLGDPSGLESFPLFLLSGLLPWNFFAGAIGNSMGSVVGNGGLIKKVYFSRDVLVFSAVFSTIITLLVEMGLLIVALVIAGNWRVLFWIPVLLAVIALLAVFATGIALMLSALNVFFRDVGYLWSIVSQAWFYVTPIVYPAALVADRPRLKLITDLNPMGSFAAAFRNVMYDLRWPPLWRLGYLTVLSAVVYAIGLYVFRQLSHRFAEEL